MESISIMKLDIEENELGDPDAEFNDEPEDEFY